MAARNQLGSSATGPSGTDPQPPFEITGLTRVYAHLAHPSSHVRTPQQFNAGFRARGLDVITVSIDVAPADLSRLVHGLRGWRNLAGIGVTIPHKETVVAEIDELIGLTRHIKAVNNIRREPDGRFVGMNTDGAGLVASLREADRNPEGRRALLVGVGGAGRALAFALADAGVAQLTLANRTQSRAVRLAEEISGVYPAVRVGVGPPDPSEHDLVVNATSLGMHEGDALPLAVERLEPGTLVVDIVMARPRTELMLEAERRGCTVHPGILMLDAQIEMVVDFLRLRETPVG